MTDQDPATLSSTLLARKGMAGSDGFTPAEMDPSRPAWPRRRTARLVALVVAAAALGATGTWVTTHDVGTTAPSPPRALPPERTAAVALPEPAASTVVPDQPVAASNAPAAASPVGIEPNRQSSLPGPSSGAAEDAKAFTQTSRSEVANKPVQTTAFSQGTMPKTPTPSGHLIAKGQATASTYRIQLHTLQSREAVEREWARLRRQHGDLLADKQLVINRLDVAGAEPRYRMQLGNLPTKTAARQLCRALADRGQKCMLVPTT